MTKQGCVSPIADTLLSMPEAIPDLSFPDARCIVTPDNEHASRWLHMICMLGATGGTSDTITKAIQRGQCSSIDRVMDCDYGFSATIEILDRPSAVSVVLSWRDPTRCHYGYQSWLKSVAKRTGICALSGGPVRRGDSIFRPAARGGKPSNASAMILAVHIDCPQLAVSSDTTPDARQQQARDVLKTSTA